jgi:hypothetical protein
MRAAYRAAAACRSGVNFLLFLALPAPRKRERRQITCVPSRGGGRVGGGGTRGEVRRWIF